MELGTMCYLCKHFDGRSNRTNPKCKAFPDQIPAEIFEGDYDHRVPHDGDNGVLFEPKGEGALYLVQVRYGVNPVPNGRLTRAETLPEIEEMLNQLQP